LDKTHHPDSIKCSVHDGYIILSGQVNQQCSGKFLLDTGADASVICPEFAGKLNLKIQGRHVGHVAGGGEINVPLTTLKNLSVGPKSIPLNPVAVVNINEDPGPYGKIDGIIGSDFIREFPITLDYKEEKIVFESAHSLLTRLKSGIKVPLIILNETTPYLTVYLENQISVDYKLDTGAGLTYLRLNDLNRIHPKFKTEAKCLKSGSLAGEYDVWETKLKSFSVGDNLEIENLKIRAYKSDLGFVGANYLKHFALTLNYNQKYIILK